jgi:ubiquinone/menaquinone biosynthesis C-methylase UbiE
VFANNGSIQKAIEIQNAYYAATAADYEAQHLIRDQEHVFALEFLIAAVKYLGVRSVLDIGSGTGRAVHKIKRELPEIQIVGIEPSAELRAIGYSNGLSESELIQGDAMSLEYEDGSFDLVCEFAALHHMPEPSRAVSEMMRVAKRAIFISDSNNFGQGRPTDRLIKQLLNALHLWPLVNQIKTRGKGYTIGEGDGLSYSYSVFNDYAQIRKGCSTVHFLNTRKAGPNFYRSASHVALLGLRGP